MQKRTCYRLAQPNFPEYLKRRTIVFNQSIKKFAKIRLRYKAHKISAGISASEFLFIMDWVECANFVPPKLKYSIFMDQDKVHFAACYPIMS